MIASLMVAAGAILLMLVWMRWQDKKDEAWEDYVIRFETETIPRKVARRRKELQEAEAAYLVNPNSENRARVELAKNWLDSSKYLRVGSDRAREILGMPPRG